MKCLEYGLPQVVILSEYMAPLRAVKLRALYVQNTPGRGEA